jgi:hypothetical protein
VAGVAALVDKTVECPSGLLGEINASKSDIRLCANVESGEDLGKSVSKQSHLPDLSALW